MPSSAGIAPWLQAADPAKEFMQAYQASAQVAQANARLQQQGQQIQLQAQQRQQELEARKAERERQEQMDQQRIEIQKSYHQQQMGLQQQKLEQDKSMFDQKTQMAAQKMQSQNKYSQDYQSMVDSGMEPGDASIKSALQNPGFMGGGSGLAAVNRAAQATVPKNLEMKTQEGKQFYRSSPTEAYKMVPGGSDDKVLGHQPVISGFTSLRKMEEDYRAADDKTKKKLAPAIEDQKRQINSYYQSKNQTLPFPKVGESAGLPLPKTKAELKEGETYQTKHGPAKWDGENFVTE